MNRFAPYVFLRDFASRWDVLAFIVVIGLIAFLGETSRGLFAPLSQLEITPLSLSPSHLPEYAARTTFRMLAGLVLSLVFTLTYATWAAKSERAGKLLVPILDILQSVPIVGCVSVTMVFFMSLAPGRVLGAEFAAIFAIFTSQAWNMAFSFYQSLRTVPSELVEAARVFRLSAWMRFWRVEAPFGMPQLIWNMMMSMSGSWFFVVASEAISVGNTTVLLPGVGSYIALAIEQKSLAAAALWWIGRFVIGELSPSDIGLAFALGLATLARIVILIAIASLIWVPIGVWVGTHPRATRVVQPIAQFLAAFPANLLFPIAVSAIVAFRLNPDIWLSPLMILGTQWYILFNVIAGAAAIPSELRDCCTNLQVNGWLWWRTTALPAVFPYYLTGAITASGGSWNASIVAEVASWGDQHLEAYGLGAYIARATQAGDFHRIVLGIAVMSLFVVIINRSLWRPLSWYAERNFRL